MNTRTVLQATAVLLLAVALFPPVDHVVPADFPATIGGSTVGGSPELRVNVGFQFIGKLESREQIRLPQWLIELGVVAAAGALFAAARRAPLP